MITVISCCWADLHTSFTNFIFSCLVLKARKGDQSLFSFIFCTGCPSVFPFFANCICFFNFLEGTCTAYLAELLFPHIPARKRHSSSDQHMVSTPLTKTIMYNQRLFIYGAANQWCTFSFISTICSPSSLLNMH